MGLPEYDYGARFEADESRAWEPGVIEIDVATQNSMNQGIESSVDDNDSTELERTDLGSPCQKLLHRE